MSDKDAGKAAETADAAVRLIQATVVFFIASLVIFYLPCLSYAYAKKMPDGSQVPFALAHSVVCGISTLLGGFVVYLGIAAWQMYSDPNFATDTVSMWLTGGIVVFDLLMSWGLFHFIIDATQGILDEIGVEPDDMAPHAEGLSIFMMVVTLELLPFILLYVHFAG